MKRNIKTIMKEYNKKQINMKNIEIENKNKIKNKIKDKCKKIKHK